MKYSKKIIENTIRHWQKILNETNMSTLMNRLEDAFGRRNVYTSDKNVVMNPTNTLTVYNMLNEVCFDNVLSMPEFQYSANPVDHNGKPLPPNVQGGYISRLTFTPDGVRKIGRSKIIFRKFATRPHLLFFTSVLCHEMIHQHNMEHGPALAYLTWCLRNGQQPEMHPDFFTRMMDKIIKEQRLGMCVVLKHDPVRYQNELIMYARASDDKYRAVDMSKTPYDMLMEKRKTRMDTQRKDEYEAFNEADAPAMAKSLTKEMVDADILKNGDDSVFAKISDNEYSVCLF